MGDRRAMWIAIRLVLAAMGFVIRQLSRGRAPKRDLSFDGTPYAQTLR